MAEYQISAVLKARDAGLTATLKSAAKAAEGLGKSVTSGVEKGVKGVEKGVKGVTSQQIVAKAGVEGLAKIERLKGAMEAARAATARPMDLRINSGDLAKITRLGQETARPIDIRARDDASSKLQKIRSELASLTGKAWTAVVNIKNNGAAALGKMKAGASELAGGAALAMGAPILGMAGVSFGAVNAVQSQMDFEKQMSTVKAIISSKYRGDAAGLEKTMELLTAKAEEMGATTKFTAKEAAEGLYYMGMAGWGAQQMLAGLPPVLKLAIAGNAELGRTSDIVTDSMTAFGLKAGTYIKNSKGDIVEASQFYADLFGALITNANTDVYGAGEALKYAAPAVQAMYANGTDTDKLNGAQDLFWVLGLMANSGIKGSQAGTSARAMFTRLGSQNRNAYFADNALGVDFVGENGEVRRLRDIVSDFQNVVRNGVDMDKVSDFFEQISGEKIHADTRRKLNAYLENVQANGGKMSGAELMKMVSMLSGQEAMSGWLAAFLAPLDEAEGLFSALENAEGTLETMSKIQMDNLAGSFVLLSSAWDAFQRNLVKGEASKGLRSFVDSVTDTLSKANKLFEDGLDIGDFGAIIIDVIAKLKAKFLELDGIGSILAGGALVMGLKKILSLALSVKDTLSTWSKVRTLSDAGNALRAGKTSNAGLPNMNGLNLNANTVNIRAGVVNVSGPIKGGGVNNRGGGVNRAAAAGTGAVVSSSAAVGGGFSNKINSPAAYYERKSQIRSQLSQKTTTPPAATPPIIPPSTSTSSAASTSSASGAIKTMAGGVKASAGMGALAAILGAMDVAATRADTEYRVNIAREDLENEKAELKFLKENSDSTEQIQAQVEKVARKEAAVKEAIELGALNERHAEASAKGAVAGTIAGAAIGSVVPLIGTAVGGMIGGILGQFFGVKMSDMYVEQKAAAGVTSESAAAGGGNGGAGGGNGAVVAEGGGAAVSEGMWTPATLDENTGLLTHNTRGDSSSRSVGDFRREDEAALNAYREAEYEKEASVYRGYSEATKRRREQDKFESEHRPRATIGDFRYEEERLAQAREAEIKKAADDEKAVKQYMAAQKNLQNNNATTLSSVAGNVQTDTRDENQKRRDEEAQRLLEEQRLDNTFKRGMELKKAWDDWFDVRGRSEQRVASLKEESAAASTTESAAAESSTPQTPKAAAPSKDEQQPASTISEPAMQSAAVESATESAASESSKSAAESVASTLSEKAALNATSQAAAMTSTTNGVAAFLQKSETQKAAAETSLGEPESAVAGASLEIKNASGFSEEAALNSTQNWAPLPSPKIQTAVPPEESAAASEKSAAESVSASESAKAVTNETSSITDKPTSTSPLKNITSSDKNKHHGGISGTESATSLEAIGESAIQAFGSLFDISKINAATTQTSKTTSFSEAAANITNNSTFDATGFNLSGQATNFDEIARSVTSSLSDAKAAAESAFTEITTSIGSKIDSMKTAASTGFTEISESIGTAFDGAKSSAAAAFSEIATASDEKIASAKTAAAAGFSDVSEAVGSAFESVKSAASAVFENVTATVAEGVESLKSAAAATFDEIATSVGTGLESVSTAVTAFAENIATSVATGFESMKTAAASTFEEISMSVSTGLESLQTTASTLLEGLSLAFSTAFESVLASASSVFESLGTTVSASVETAYASITTAFSGAAAEVQGIWSAMTGFFSGVFGGLGGIAAAAGSAIAAGINSGIGIIQSAWEALSGWLSSKIASISAMASEAAAFVGIGSNYTGTSNWRGGLTTVNEHGGELIILPSGQTITPYQTASAVLNNTTKTASTANSGGVSLFSGSWSEVDGTGSELMYLPAGTKIIPHATTVSILRSEIRDKLATFKSQTDELGNIRGADIPEYNRITAADSIAVRRAKLETQRRAIGRVRDYSGFNFFNSSDTAKTDARGNITGLDVPVYNKITGRDDLTVRRAKYQAQLGQFQIQKRWGFENKRGWAYRRFGSRDESEDSRRIRAAGVSSIRTASANVEGSAASDYCTDELGNILNLNGLSENVMTGADSIAVQKAKRAAQYREFIFKNNKIAHNYSGTNRFGGGLTTVNEHGGELIRLPGSTTIYPAATVRNIFANEFRSNYSTNAKMRRLPKTDRLGNIRGLDIPSYNKITSADSLTVRRAKYQAQLQQFKTERQTERLSSLSKKAAIVQRLLSFSESRNQASRSARADSSTTAFMAIFAGTPNAATQTAARPSEKTATSRLNIFKKTGSALHDFFYKIFHPRKAAAKARGYTTDRLGNIVGLNGLAENVITGAESIAVQRAKRIAQHREFLEKHSQTSHDVFNQPAAVSDTSNFSLGGIPDAPAPSNAHTTTKTTGWLTALKAITAIKNIRNARRGSRLNALATIANAASSIQNAGANIKKTGTTPASTTSTTTLSDIFSNTGGALNAAERKIASSNFASTNHARSNFLADLANILIKNKRSRGKINFNSAWKPILHQNGADIFNTNPATSKIARNRTSISNSRQSTTSSPLTNLIKRATSYNIISPTSNALTSGANFNEQLPILSDFDPLKIGDLPAPNFASAGQNLNTTTTTTDNSKNTSSRTSANFNFGDIHITSGMDFEEFAHRLARLFTQSSANFAG